MSAWVMCYDFHDLAGAQALHLDVEQHKQLATTQRTAIYYYINLKRFVHSPIPQHSVLIRPTHVIAGVTLALDHAR